MATDTDVVLRVRHRPALRYQAEMIWQSSNKELPEDRDRKDV